MPGLLSQIFDEGAGAGGGDATSTEAQSTDATLDLSQDVDLDVGVGVGVEMGGSYQELDGSTTTWSNSQDVGLDADVDGAVGAVLSTGTDEMSYDA